MEARVKDMNLENNNNQTAIKKLAKKSFQANRLRNIVIILAIILTTIMFTVLFTISYSMKKSTEQATLRKIGGFGDIEFENLSKKQLEKIITHPLIQTYNYNVYLGNACNVEFVRSLPEIRYAGDNQASLSLAAPTVGNLPEKENELATDTFVLDALGIPHKLGEKVTLRWKKDIFDSEYLEDEFILTGFWEGDPIAMNSRIWISKPFLDENFPLDKRGKNYHLNFTIEDPKQAEFSAETILLDLGYQPKKFNIGYNWSTEDPTDRTATILFAAGILLVVISGYFIIFNVIQISISKDIWFYGMLKTIGTTSKQINKFIYQQSFYLCIIGIPIGLFSGYGISFFILPLILFQEAGSFVLSTEPIIFLGSALFTIFTVILSGRKPARMASKVSPIEAVRYTETEMLEKKSTKSSRNHTSILRMAFVNLGRNKKRTFITICSLSLGFVALNSIATFSNSFDVEKYLSDRIVSDFSLSDSSLHQMGMGGYQKENTTISKLLQNQLNELDGLQGIGNVYYQETQIKLSDKSKKIITDFYSKEEVYQQLSRDPYWLASYEEMKETGTLSAIIYGLDDFVLKKADVYQGNFDLELFQTGDYILEVSIKDNGDMHDNDEIGDSIIIDKKEYKVMGYMDSGAITDGNRTLSRAAHDKKYVLPSHTFLEQYGTDTPVMKTLLDVEDNAMDSVKNFMENYRLNTDRRLSIDSRETYVKAYRNETTAQDIMGKLLSFIIMLVGILNFINSIITSIATRHREFALLNCIGMTKKQILYMLKFEGFTYVFFTGIISLIIGSVISLSIIKTYLTFTWTSTYHFTVTPILISTGIVTILAMVIPYLYFKRNILRVTLPYF